jgi:hypothetical protein
VASLERRHVREVNLMPVIFERKLFKIGEGGIAVTLPKSWIDYYKLKPGDKVRIIVERELTIEPTSRDGPRPKSI